MGIFASVASRSTSPVTDGMRAGMGIAVKDAGLASEELGRGDGGAPGGNGALNGGVPVARVEQGGRLTHVVRYSDSATPMRRAKPRWAQLDFASNPPPSG